MYAMIGSGITCRKNARKGKSRTHGKAACPGHRCVRYRSPAQRLRRPLELLPLFHPFDGKVQRYSDVERLIAAISQKMLTCNIALSRLRDGLINAIGG
ncbi:winged helix-turn-helix transcriptional regulator [Xanthomonas floridensis]|uniref:Winged helix-turn-helix transcriptional regulator n=1 Tax=Xanthomonas floridensis TaxID=1843580 RepID=A0ABU5Q210_9XANT|nr:winged helix-turn-helix transcriptional regulator [Xanthomonas floridensis]MEA5125662.1 winged helix-turn-helix transcriptional regulator [Xanthomonas floridensis]MEA5133537.1 winged helix-turn-helix transcriptional regulator [Xanthomonas floridensis]